MSRDKNKNLYGTFVAKKGSFSKMKKTATLSVLVVVLIVGVGAAVFKLVHKSKPAKVAETKALDEIPGWWYKQYFGASVCANDGCLAQADPDSDKLSNVQEFFYHTDPINPHTVQDKLNDGQLVAAGFDPSRAGRVTFDQVITPENLLGESLVFSDDIKKMVADSNDISKVSLSLVKDGELKVVYGESNEIYALYRDRLESTLNKYFPKQGMYEIQNVLKSGNETELNSIRLKAEAVSMELKNIPVPLRFEMYHKYSIALFELMAQVMIVPQNNFDDAWFDKMQQFLAVQQKLSFEEQRLKQLDPVK